MTGQEKPTLPDALPTQLLGVAEELLTRNTTMQAILVVLRHRTPPRPSTSAPVSQQVAESFERAGYEKCLEELMGIYKAPPVDAQDPLASLLDHRD